VVPVIGDAITMKEADEAHRRATGKPLPKMPLAIGGLIIKLNEHTQDLCVYLIYASLL
jgi:hypothetical protein